MPYTLSHLLQRLTKLAARGHVPQFPFPFQRIEEFLRELVHGEDVRLCGQGGVFGFGGARASIQDLAALLACEVGEVWDPSE